MNWSSPAEFFAMGGYAFYVWGSYGVAAALMVAELWLLATRRRTFLERSRRRLDRANDAE